jgi:hypothetical protein
VIIIELVQVDGEDLEQEQEHADDLNDLLGN